MLVRTILTISASILVSACGGENSNVASARDNLIANSASDIISTKFNGQTLPARTVSLLDDGRHQRISTTSSYSYNRATNELTLTIGDAQQTLDLSPDNTSLEQKPQFVSQNSPFAAFWAPIGQTLNEYRDGTGAYLYLVPISNYLENNSGQIYRDYGVIGVETPSTYLSSGAPVANYTGEVFIDQYDTRSSSLENSSGLYGSLSMTVDFAAQTMTGGLVNSLFKRTSADGAMARGGTISILPATIDDATNTFTANLQSNLPGLTIRTGGELSGGFYGNTAQEVGGTISYEGQMDGVDIIAGGVFIGQKN